MKFGKKGVLIINLGTPDAPEFWAVWRYLKQFLLDGRVIDIPTIKRNLLVRGIILPTRTRNSTNLYKELWTEEGSPLKVYGYQVVEGVRKELGDDYEVELAMRYQNPSIESAIEKLLAKNVSEIIVFPMFPQYASASTGSAHEEVMRVLTKKQVIPTVKMINSYYDFEPMIEVYAENAKKYNLEEYDHIIFSYHGIPQRQILKADNCNHCLKTADCCQSISIKNQFCYSAQSYGTTKALVEKLGLKEGTYTTSFQSQLGSDPWTKPATIKVIEELAKKGAKKLLIFSPAFVADCLETTVEILTEYQEEFEEMGGEHIDLVESLNAHPKWISAIASLVKES